MDDVKAFNPFHYGEHFAFDVHTKEKKKPYTFKAPQMTYEGFVPCNPPKCPRVHKIPNAVLQAYTTSTVTPDNVYTTSTIAHKEYPSTTPPPKIPKYEATTETIHNGFLVDYYLNNAISNSIEESNLCELNIL